MFDRTDYFTKSTRDLSSLFIEQNFLEHKSYS